jgi:hypothetical protein
MADGIRVLSVDDEPGLSGYAKAFPEQIMEYFVGTSTSAIVAPDSPGIRSCEVIISVCPVPETPCRSTT